MTKEAKTTKETICIFADKIHHNLYKILSLKNEKIGIYSGEDALKVIITCQANIAIIDCGFNNTLGLKLLKKLKSLHPEVPVIFLADKSSEELAINAFRAGTREYLRKPVDINILRDLIKNLLKVKRGSKEKRKHFVVKRIQSLNYPLESATSDKPLSLLRAIHFIEENLNDRISLASCSRASNLSKYHFCRTFKKHMGVSPMKFVNLMRINRAKELIQTTDDNIVQIAFSVGFNDHSTFAREFKKSTGSTPKKYRESLKKK